MPGWIDDGGGGVSGFDSSSSIKEIRDDDGSLSSVPTGSSLEQMSVVDDRTRVDRGH